MRVLALLSYYDEKPSWLKDVVVSLKKIGADHLCALDGAYALYPNGRPQSPVACHRTLEKTCDRVGIDLTHVAPTEVWAGNEVEKRTRLFQLAETVSTEDDWFVVIDGDSPIISADGFREMLETTDKLVGSVRVMEKKPDGAIHNIFPRAVFKAQRGIRVVGQHFDYRCGDMMLWGNYGVNEVDGEKFPIIMEHRTLYRRQARFQASQEYYRRRDELGAEFGSCAWCEARTPRTIPYQWHERDGYINAKRANVCDDCRPQRGRESLAQLAAFGYVLTNLEQLPAGFLQ